jgi:uncharacterized protein involved in exopolysaccharide biosynthesis
MRGVIMERLLKDALLLLALPLLAGLVFGIASLSWGPRYAAEATLMMGSGPEYDGRTVLDDSGDASRWTLERILNTEAEIFNTDDLKRDVIRKIGADPILGTSPDNRKVSGLRYWLRRLGLLPPAPSLDVEALKVLQRGLEIKPVKNSGILHVSFTHDDKAMSVQILQSLLDGYIDLRRSILQVDEAATLRGELQQNAAAYQQLMDKRRQLAKENQVSDLEQERQALNERDATLRTEADQLARELASTTRQIEVYETAGSNASDRLAALNAEKIGQEAAATSVGQQLSRIGDQHAHLDQVAGAFQTLDQDLAARKATIAKLNEMIAAADLTKALSKVTSPPRLLQAPTAGDDPVSLPSFMIAGLAAVATLVAVIAVRLLEHRDHDLEVAFPGNASRKHAALSPLAASGTDNAAGPELKRKGLGGTRA